MAEHTTGKKFIRIRGANVNNLKNLSVDIPRDEFVVLTGVSRYPENLLWLLIPFMQKDRDVTWNLFLPMQDSFWDRWKNRMWK